MFSHHGAVGSASTRRIRLSHPLLITHTDMDGSCCAICFREVFPDSSVLYTDYDRINAVLQSILDEGHDGLVVVADILGRRDLMTELFATRGPLKLRFFDHHKEGEYLNSWPGSKHDIQRCGGLILAQELGCPQHCIDFAEVVDCYDRWVKDDSNFELAQDLNLLHKFIGQNRFVARGADLMLSREEDDLLEILKERDQKDIDQWTKHAQTFLDGDGNCFLFLVGVTNVVAHAVLIGHPAKAAYAVIWNSRFNTVTLCSTDEGPDVQVLAKRLGGGGHRNAAGFPVSPTKVAAVARALLLLET